ncbi:PREDICTED: inactive peptidyl-prolyl cis-trans isomerase FKBP6 [Polistes canadensis]|uniref:inactive peptidyl-prolyl cis-trans isomerase FKBP6 n=1 Tax=Polistes canadensis TaxID=91411 RepID=UPI000718C846|nr:PREDICTED: inactive peptidyl-prolyl cis-trans isomerase FKBP6 [Polistes canadensis]
MATPLNVLDGLTLNDLLSPEGFTFEIGDEYIQKEEENNCSYDSNVFLSNDEIIDMLNIDNLKNEETEDYESAVTNVIGISFAKLKSKMIPVTEDKKIMKLIKRKGAGAMVSFKSQVTIKYISFFEYSDEPFDSTFAQGKPKTIRLDHGLLIPGLELALTTMEKHEISIFIIHPDLAYGRLGCPPRILPNTEVMFIVHLVDFLDIGSADTYITLSVDEKKLLPNIIKCVNDLLNSAKHYFKKMAYKTSIREYQKAIRLLEDAELKDDNEEEEVKRLLSRSYNNLAICFNKIDMPRRACMACIKVPVPTVKTYFNHGKALIKIGEYTKGLKKLEFAYKMEPKDKNIYREICLANQKYNQYYQMEKTLWSNCLNISGKEKHEIEFQKAAHEMCKVFAEDNYLSSQPFPEGLTQEEENYIREQAAALGLNVVNQIKYNKKILYLTKKIY